MWLDSSRKCLTTAYIVLNVVTTTLFRLPAARRDSEDVCERVIVVSMAHLPKELHASGHAWKGAKDDGSARGVSMRPSSEDLPPRSLCRGPMVSVQQTNKPTRTCSRFVR